jgi:hypothetical protein
VIVLPQTPAPAVVGAGPVNVQCSSDTCCCAPEHPLLLLLLLLRLLLLLLLLLLLATTVASTACTRLCEQSVSSTCRRGCRRPSSSALQLVAASKRLATTSQLMSLSTKVVM